LRTIKAAELLGVRSVLTGVRPPVARIMVSLGTTLAEVQTCATLQQGLELCMRLMSEEKTRTGSARNGPTGRSSGPAADRE
jgi:hypothetical protein